MKIRQILLLLVGLCLVVALSVFARSGKQEPEDADIDIQSLKEKIVGRSVESFMEEITVTERPEDSNDANDFTCTVTAYWSEPVDSTDEKLDTMDTLKRWVKVVEGNPIKQRYIHMWGNVPMQNACPHCGESSYTRFCTDCGKERGNIPFIGVYCPNCNPGGKYPAKSDDVTKICGNCGGKRTWKYVYEDWQTKPSKGEQR